MSRAPRVLSWLLLALPAFAGAALAALAGALAAAGTPRAWT